MMRQQVRSVPYASLARQRGQALVYGIFMLLFGMASLFFMFNTGQMTAEKTKLVNTADAVAYSAAVMHARALNFDAYTNRALVANEMTIAQMVSVTSWIKYANQHASRVTPLNCTNQYSVPAVLVVVKYAPLCFALAWQFPKAALEAADQAVAPVAQAMVFAADAAKVSLQAAQVTMFAAFVPARTRVMNEVAEANYLNDGAVHVDTVPFEDDFMLFEGSGPVLARYTGNDRARMRDLDLAAMRADGFMGDRTWSDNSPWGCSPVLLRGKAEHSASTGVLGYDGWTANDSARFTTELYGWRRWSYRCRTQSSYDLGSGIKTARTNPVGGDWKTIGIPSFFELSKAALKYTAANSNADKRDLRLKFAIRLTRARNDQRTSAGSSAVKPSGRLAIFEGNQASDMMAAVATSEVYFERIDGKKEYGSLFNPYWQAHLVGNSADVTAAATALQKN